VSNCSHVRGTAVDKSDLGGLEGLFDLPGGSIVRGCWCMYYRKAGKVSVSHATGASHKQELHALVCSGTVPGLLGYADGSAVGWISLGPREDYRKLERSRVMRAVDNTPVWSIVCTYVAKVHRGKGYQHKLLTRAIDYARDQGVRMLEAYPVDKPERSHDDFMFFGSRSLYERAGFREVVRRSPTRLVMRRGLRPRRTIEGWSAGEDLCLLRGELFLGQHSGFPKLSKLLKLREHVGLGCCGLLRRWRRRRLLLLGCLLLVLLRPPIGLSA
jgi:GNAT superfamily N-acetyltransferase